MEIIDKRTGLSMKDLHILLYQVHRLSEALHEACKELAQLKSIRENPEGLDTDGLRVKTTMVERAVLQRVDRNRVRRSIPWEGEY